MRRLSILLAGLLSLAVTPAFAAPGILSGNDATPNFVGSTGLLETPNADTVGDKGFSVFAGFNPDYNTYGVLFGPFDRLEVGVSFFDIDSGDDGFAVNAKFGLLKESTFIPGVAVGVVDAFDEINQGHSWYVVASKDIGKLIPLHPFDIKASVGYGGGIYGNDPFASLEFGIGTPLDAIPLSHPRFSFIPEVRDGDVNLGLRAKWRGFGATVALFDFDRIGAMFSYSAGLRL
jgi:hypothetical protein